MTTLNIIGCGRAARTCARLWVQQDLLTVGEVLTRSPQSAAEAVRFIGQGQAVSTYEALNAAPLWLLGVPDREIAPTVAALAASGTLRSGDGVFHLSGFTSSEILAPLRAAGVRTASVHPVMSFADPQRAIERFAGTPCGVEGEASLAAELTQLFAAVGGTPFPLDGNEKPLYHAGSVFASNFLVVILDAARRAYVDAGVPPEMAERMLATLSRGALENVIALDAAAALTGPAARGDREVVSAQHAAVTRWDPEAGEAYDALSRLAFRLAGRR